MKIAYYPGCSAHGTGIETDQSTRELCRILGIELADLPDWNCCGASSAHVVSSELALGLNARNLAQASAIADEVVTPCPACFNRMAEANHHIKQHGAPEKAGSIKENLEVRHVIDLFSQKDMLKKIAKAATRGLNGMKVVTYYGCLTSRPPEITGAKNPENPTEMDVILEALGAEVIDWPLKTQCCGGSLTIPKDEIVANLSNQLYEMAARAGAEAIVTHCAMCFTNLERQWANPVEGDHPEPLPVFYFTELMMLAMDPAKAQAHFRRHLSDPNPLLSARGLS